MSTCSTKALTAVLLVIALASACALGTVANAPAHDAAVGIAAAGSGR